MLWFGAGKTAVGRSGGHLALVLVGVIAWMSTAEVETQETTAEFGSTIEARIGELDLAYRDLAEGRRELALDRVAAVRAYVLDELYSDLAAYWLIGELSFVRALAAAGAGNLHDAAWDMQMAMTYADQFRTLDLTTFGEAGALLSMERHRLLDLLDRAAAAEPPIKDPSVEPPVRITAPFPAYPEARRGRCQDGRVTIRVRLGSDGVPSMPMIVSSRDPVLAYAALDAMRRWRFEPARRDGEPVVVWYDLTVNFRLEH